MDAACSGNLRGTLWSRQWRVHDRRDLRLAEESPGPSRRRTRRDHQYVRHLSLGLFKTIDGGQNWTALSTPNYCPYACDYSNVIRVDPVDANVVYVGGVFLFFSTDGGMTWGDAGNNASLHVDHHAIAFSADGTRLLDGSDGGVLIGNNFTTNPGWGNPIRVTLAITQFYNGLSIDPTNVNHGFGGTQDNGMLRYSWAID